MFLKQGEILYINWTNVKEWQTIKNKCQSSLCNTISKQYIWNSHTTKIILLVGVGNIKWHIQNKTCTSYFYSVIQNVKQKWDVKLKFLFNI